MTALAQQEKRIERQRVDDQIAAMPREQREQLERLASVARCNGAAMALRGLAKQIKAHLAAMAQSMKIENENDARTFSAYRLACEYIHDDLVAKLFSEIRDQSRSI